MASSARHIHLFCSFGGNLVFRNFKGHPYNGSHWVDNILLRQITYPKESFPEINFSISHCHNSYLSYQDFYFARFGTIAYCMVFHRKHYPYKKNGIENPDSSADFCHLHFVCIPGNK